jgi:hypothetical protein
MPNHVDCELTVSCNEDNQADLKSFKKFAREGKLLLSANKFIPYPKHFSDLDKASEKWDSVNKGKQKVNWNERPQDGYNQGGYEWCIREWGTKWGMYSTTIEEEDYDRIKYSFQSAWGPPLPVIKAMGVKFPTLRFHLQYYEGGCGFQGEYVMSDGEEQENRTCEYSGDRGG